MFLAGSGAALAAPPIITARSEELADLELILGLDASGSMLDNQKAHWNIQNGGHFKALEDNEIIETLVTKKVHLRIIAWAEMRRLIPIVFDKRILSASDVVAAKVSLGRIFLPWCEPSLCNPATEHHCLIKQVIDLPRKGHQCILDVSTDEVPKSEFKSELEEYRTTFEQQGGRVNAIAVEMSRSNADLLRERLCSSSGFCLRAKTWGAYPEIIKQKIGNEIG
jgi:hypothetical protein